jgi:hypothetical protein
MFYKVSDIGEYEKPGDEIIADRIEADTADAAIIAALKAISSSTDLFLVEALQNDPEAVAKYILPEYVAEAVA